MITFDILVELFTAATEPWGHSGWYHVAPPTPESVERIQRELGIIIPRIYASIAAACPSYGGWLAGIGDDYDHGCHILNLNAAFHTAVDQPALPQHYVLLNHGHDGDCDCWDTREATSCGEHPVVYVDLEAQRSVAASGRRFDCFRDYLERHAIWGAARNGKARLSAAARQAISEHAHFAT